MPEAGRCESCFHYKRRGNEADFLFKVCDIHRDPKVVKTLENAEEVGAPEVRGFFMVNPSESVCRRYAPNLFDLYVKKLFRKKGTKKIEEPDAGSEESAS